MKKVYIVHPITKNDTKGKVFEDKDMAIQRASSLNGMMTYVGHFSLAVFTVQEHEVTI